MLFLVLFAVIGGSLASLIFFLVYKRHIKKNGTVKEKSFTLNAPKIFGTVNIILAIVFFGMVYYKAGGVFGKCGY